MMIKICGITRREDALAAVDAGASALGFIFFPKSPRYVTPAAAAELGEGLDAWKVGVFVDESPAAIESVMRAAKLDIAQVYGGSAPEKARVWKAFRPADSVSMDGAEAILLDGPANGISFDWTIARDETHKIIVAGGLDASNVAGLFASQNHGAWTRVRNSNRRWELKITKRYARSSKRQGKQNDHFATRCNRTLRSLRWTLCSRSTDDSS